MSRSQSLSIVFVAYVLAFIMGVFLVWYMPEGNNLGKLFFIDVALTFFIFMFSFRFGNASIYDPYWSIIPVYILVFWWYNSLAIPNYLTWGITSLVVLVWSVRLTNNWVRGWKGMHHQDWRYVLLQQKTGKWYLLVNFLGIHMFPTLLVWLAAIPIAYIFTSNQAFSIANWVGVVLALAGTVLEWVSDNQLRSFKKMNKRAEVMTAGVWSYLRHPNYLGEILFWWGLYFMSVSVFTPWHVALGAVGITLLFVFISIPMMDKHMLQQRPAYARYMLEVRALIPVRKG
ncbi:MAG: DUF1295 domain-containing protein [Cyclobacteriaceae bacterium]|nr:DUF1295 domain-containing protein [Cyclobacteriaceae bacterium]